MISNPVKIAQQLMWGEFRRETSREVLLVLIRTGQWPMTACQETAERAVAYADELIAALKK